MILIKKVYIYLATILLIFSSLLLPSAWFFTTNFSRPYYLDNLVNHSDLYQITIKSIEDQIGSLPQIKDLPESNLINQYVDLAVQKSLPRYYFNDQIDQIIKANFQWLNGKTKYPKYDINLNQIKLTLINNLNYQSEQIANQCKSLIGSSECNNYNLINQISINQFNRVGIFRFNKINYQNFNQFLNILYGNKKTKSYINYHKLSYLPKDYRNLLALRDVLLLIDVIVLLMGLLIIGLRFKFLKLIFKVVLMSSLVLYVLSLLNNLIRKSILNNQVFKLAKIGNFLTYLVKQILSSLTNYNQRFIKIYLIILVLMIIVWLIVRLIKKPFFNHKNKKSQTDYRQDNDNQRRQIEF